MKNRFCFAGKDIATLARKKRTPFFLFNEAQIEENYKLIKNSFSSGYKNLRIDYSAKTNLELSILKIVKRLGVDLEISCTHELKIGRKAGFSPSQMIIDTPVNQENEIMVFIKEGVRAFYGDSLDEIRRIQKVAGRLKKEVAVVLRINPGFPLAFLNPAELYLRKFGILEGEIPSAVEFTQSEAPNLKIIGLSIHVGSQQLDPRSHLRALKKIFRLAEILEEKGIEIKEVCLGGGYPSLSLSKKTLVSLLLSFLGINFHRPAKPVEKFGNNISKAFNEKAQKLKSRPTLVIQPGRSLVANTGIAVGEVMVVKRKWIFINLSASSLPESLFFGQRKLVLANKYQKKPVGKYNVAGGGLNTADNLGIGWVVPKPEVGDVIVVLDAGAYSISRANRFTTLTPPVYLVTKNGRIKRIRRQETHEDILAPMEA